MDADFKGSNHYNLNVHKLECKLKKVICCELVQEMIKKYTHANEVLIWCKRASQHVML